jgi:hypothetical protein
VGGWGDELGDVPGAAFFAVACSSGVGGDVGAGELVELSEELVASISGCGVTSI